MVLPDHNSFYLNQQSKCKVVCGCQWLQQIMQKNHFDCWFMINIVQVNSKVSTWTPTQKQHPSSRFSDYTNQIPSSHGDNIDHITSHALQKQVRRPLIYFYIFYVA